MHNFKERVETLRSQINSIKAEFAAFITHLATPLDERWEVFINAPSDLRESSGWTERFKGLPEDWIGYDGPIYAERHQDVDVEGILEILENLEDYEIDPSDFDIVAFKEDVLSRNLYSFTYDW